MAPRKSKALCDVKKRSTLSAERWAGAKFVFKLFRSAADNKVDLDVEPHMLVDGRRISLTSGYEGVTRADFVNMIRPAFPKGVHLAFLEAIPKRATVILNTHWCVYIRPAGLRDTVRIQRHAMASPTLLNDKALHLERLDEVKEKDPVILSSTAKWSKTKPSSKIYCSRLANKPLRSSAR